MLLEVATKAMAILPELPSVTCALDLVYKRLAGPCVPCWKMDKHQTSFTIPPVRGETLTCDLRVLWHHAKEAHLQARFTSPDERALQGLRDAGQRGDLRDFHRRTASQKRHTKTCTIDINMPLTLPPQVVEHIVARGPTEIVPSGTPKEFKAVVVNLFRDQGKQRLAARKARRRPAPAYGHRVISLSQLLSLDEAALPWDCA